MLWLGLLQHSCCNGWGTSVDTRRTHMCIPVSHLQGFEKTGLGERVATLFVKVFGKSTLGLAYGLSGAACN